MKQVTIVLTYTRINSTRLKIKLHKTLKQLLPTYGLRVILKISSRMKNNFNFKDKLKQELRSLSIYNLSVIAAMLSTLVIPNDIIDRNPWSILVFLHSQGQLTKVPLKLQLHWII